jgi:7-carboxy-7-deazaguanine synthase
VIADLDYVSMDVKLPSATRQAPQWEAHRRFLTVCRDRGRGRPALIVKAVVADATPLSEVEQAAALVAETVPDASFVIQPVTPVEGVRAPAPGLVLAMQAAAKERVADVRVIPQVHKFIGQR